jgi:hypothetical protein
MASAGVVSRSTPLSAVLEARIESIAVRENRSVANVMENAIRVFTLFPKEMRDVLVEAASDEATAPARFREMWRALLFRAARERFVEATVKLAASGAIDEERLADDEITVIDDRL